MKTISLRVRLGALGCIAVMGAACMAAGSCGTDLHKASVASAGIAASLNTAATVNHNDAFESAAEKQQVATYIDAVAKANDNFLGVLKAAETQNAQVGVPLIETAFGKLLDTVNNLNAQGILKLKDPKAQADFSIVMSSVQASLAAIEIIYPPLTSKNTPPRRAPWIPALAVALTPAEIDELIALVIAAGSALLPKLLALRGETDAQLIASAQTDDAAAEATAESDIAAAPSAQI
jgi:hypothetical protein